MKIYFVDFEASSLDPMSFPIEVAWVDLNGHGESYLIKPEVNWTNWSPVSQKIHGISRETLERDGLPTQQVAKRFHAALKDALIISDNPPFDEYWAHVLLHAGQLPKLKMSHLNILIAQQIERFTVLNLNEPETSKFWRQERILLDQAQVLVSNAIDQIRFGQKTKHRALPDAENLWQQWKAAKDIIDQRLLAAQTDH